VDLQDPLAMSLIVALQEATDLSRLVAMRNRLAHGHATVDIDRIWAEVPAGPDALKSYTKAIARFVPPPTG
jgi:uncharacterized protein YutE (UPF0331/DUF86 family)